MIKEKDYQQRFQYQAKLTFKNEKIKSSPDKQKVREFVGSRPSLQKILQRVYQAERKG